MNMQSNKPRSRGIYLLPNLFTIGSSFAGFFALVSAFNGHYDASAIAIFIAMIMDSLDGRVARLTNTMTDFGAQFDSLTDMVSFAVAPAFLAYTWSLSTLGKFGWLAAFIYMVAVTLRLARFNAQVDSADKRYFQGLPCPAAAAVVTSFIWICYDFGFANNLASIILVVLILSVGALMVSNVRFRSFKDAEFKSHVSFVVILIAVLVIALLIFDPSKVLFIVFISYAASGPIATILGLQQKKRLRKQVIKKHEK